MKIALEYGKDFDIKRQTEYAVKGITKICNKIEVENRVLPKSTAPSSGSKGI